MFTLYNSFTHSIIFIHSLYNIQSRDNNMSCDIHWIPFGDHPLKLERYRED